MCDSVQLPNNIIYTSYCTMYTKFKCMFVQFKQKLERASTHKNLLLMLREKQRMQTNTNHTFTHNSIRIGKRKKKQKRGVQNKLYVPNRCDNNAAKSLYFLSFVLYVCVCVFVLHTRQRINVIRKSVIGRQTVRKGMREKETETKLTATSVCSEFQSHSLILLFSRSLFIRRNRVRGPSKI